jgi:ABC-2 type transport system ATP-binding protein
VNARVLRELLDEQHKAGRTLIFSTHQMSQAEALCDRIVMIHQGKKQLDNTPAEIRSRFDPRSILVEPIDTDLAGGKLALVAGVEQVLQRGRNFEVVVLDSSDPATVLGSIASAFPCNRIQLVRPTLEDVFIEIVRSTSTSDEERAELASFATSSRVTLGDSTGD